MSGVGVKTKAIKGGGAPPLASAPEGPRRSSPNGGRPRNAPEEKIELVGKKWNTVSLGEIAESVDYGVTASSTLKSLGPKFLRITDIQDGNVNWETVPWCECDTREARSSKLLPGDIVFARTGATTGKSFLIRDCPSECVFASYLIRVRFGKAVDSGYINQFFQSNGYWKQINQNARGAAQPGVNATILKTLEIPLPPLPEQRRIAEVLDRVEGLRAKRQESITALDGLTKSIFLEMFGDPTTNPKGWPVLGVEDVCELIVDCVNRTAPIVDYPTPFKMIRTSNIKAGKINLTEIRFVTEDVFVRWNRRTTPRYGDVILTREAPVGEVGMILTDDFLFLGQRLILYRTDSKLMAPEFLLASFRGEYLQHQIDRNGSGSTVKHLPLPACRDFRVHVPPILLQREFARRIASVEKLKTTHRASLAQLDALFASLQHRAFRGEL